MANPVIPNDTKDALLTVCLFLARSGRPHAELGYETATEAFESVGTKFGVPKNTVKNHRDTFDRFTDSVRVGWKNDELSLRLRAIFDKYSEIERTALKDICLEIMSLEWEKLGDKEDEDLDEVLGNLAKATILSFPDTLPDLAECQRLSKERASKIKIDELCIPEPDVWTQILALYHVESATDKAVVVGTSSMTIETDQRKLLTISSQEFPRCWAVRPYVLGILLYEQKVDELARELGFANRGSGRGKLEIFKRLPAETWETDLAAPDVVAIKDAVKSKLALSEIEQERFLKFLSDPKWSGVSKTLERGDWTISAIVGVGGWLANASTRRGELSIALAKSDAFEELMRLARTNGQKMTSQAGSSSLFLKGGENVIFYGAPGTGKSNRVEKEIEARGKRPFRTVFHPDLQNSDFFGCLKPQMDGKEVRYGFSPGPFMKALSAAYSKPNEPVFLVIEELNRAAAAAVFGDLFLLLDRDVDGTGEYDVSFPSPESEHWFTTVTGTARTTLKLPSNLFIYATMNSADQGVFPIDTAFRRRWRQEYLPLDYKSGPDGNVAYVDATGKHHSLAWRKFVELLNRQLLSSPSIEIAEDRLLGQWFVKGKELDGNAIPEKVMLYLWDDLLRHEGRYLVFDTNNIKTYGNLASEAARGGRILSDRFLAVLDAESHDDENEQDELGGDAD